MLALIDYGSGNIHSVINALRREHADVELISDPARLSEADAVVLPGVGAFGDCVQGLQSRGLWEPIAEWLAADKPFTLEGNLLIIDHGMGLNSAFLHLSRIDVKEGQRVRKGQLLGAIGATGRATGPHLHWAMKWRSARIDPMALTGTMPGQDISKVPVTEN